MSAEAYNTERLKDGSLSAKQVTALVRFWQQNNSLEADGKFGPVTAASLPQNELFELISRLARQEIGKGEKSGGPGNNFGPEIDRYRSSTGRGVGKRGAWCAQFTSYVLLKADVDFKPSAGAKRLNKNIAKKGRWIYQPKVVGSPKELGVICPGDVITWHRGTGAGDWRGHVEIVISYDAATDTLITVGGNHNNRKDAKGRPYAVVDFFKYERGSWRKKLHGVARPASK